MTAHRIAPPPARPMFFSLPLILTVMIASACAHRSSPSWRLAGNVLVPPAVPASTVMQTRFKADAGDRRSCPPEIGARRKQVVGTMRREHLTSQPRGWLTTWAEDLEAQGCIAPGEAFPLARSIAESLPLEMNAAFQLLYPNDRTIVKLTPGVVLQVVTPILVAGADAEAPIIEAATTTANGNSLTIDARLTSNVLGYETATYSVQAKKGAPGVSIAVISVERHINGETEQVAATIRNYFNELGSAAFYELFYKGGETAFTALIVGGRDKADLDRRTNLLKTGTASSCETLKDEMCIAVPRRSAINPMVLATVNDREMLLNWGATVATAIRASGVTDPKAVLPTLALSKPYGDRMAAVEFDHMNSVILNLILIGGEKISWNRIAPDLSPD